MVVENESDQPWLVLQGRWSHLTVAKEWAFQSIHVESPKRGRYQPQQKTLFHLHFGVFLVSSPSLVVQSIVEEF
jgi:hypothetical protein